MPERHEAEYQQYLRGCQRLGQEAVTLEEFQRQWDRFEEHAEALRSAERAGSLASLPATDRAAMQQRVQNDPLVKALLVGMAEDS